MSEMKEATVNSTSPETVSDSSARCERWFPRRYVLAIMCHLAFFFRGLVVANLGMILFNHINTKEEEVQTPSISNFTMDEMRNIAYSYYFVNALGQIPSAMLAFTYSPQRIIAISMIMSAVLQMVTPWTLTKSIVGVVINVFLQALCMCPLDCACIGLLRKWAPSTEKTRLLMISFSGRYAYIQIAYWICINMAVSVGPNFIYYFAGVAGGVWCILWCTLITDSPPNASKSGLQYLEDTDSVQSKEKMKSVPLKSILKCLPVLGLCLVFTSPALSYGSLLELIYMYSIDDAATWGLCSMLINCICIIPAIGYVIDILINRKGFKTTTMRKILCCGGLILYVVFVTSHMIPNETIAAICFYTAFLVMDLTAAGVVPNVLDLSPRYCIPIFGLALTGSSVCRILSDYLQPVMFSLEDREGIIGQIPAGLFALIAALLFVIFGSGEEQTWSSTSLPTHKGHNEGENNPKSDVEGEMLVTGNL